MFTIHFYSCSSLHFLTFLCIFCISPAIGPIINKDLNPTLTYPLSFSGTIVLRSKKRVDPEKRFTFDNVFGPDSKQLDIYNICARKIVDSVLEGYNGERSRRGSTGNMAIMFFIFPVSSLPFISIYI